MKFAFIGAGSLQFTTSCMRDLLTFEAFKDAEFALMDTNAENLKNITHVCEKIAEVMECPRVKITPTTDRIEALKGADGVLCTVFNGDVDIWRHEIEIPKKYGVDINVGDTRSVSGIFRALRNIPLMLYICADIEKYCPNAVFLNYTNPMAMLCGAMQKHSNVEVTGLCHSVQGTVKMLAEWLEIPKEEIVYKCMGVNHQAFYTVLKHKGKDLYPLLREKLKDEEFYNKEIVRNEMFLKLGYYVTESSGHNSEYNQWFRKRPDLIEKYCTHGTNWNPGEYAFSLNLRLDRKANTKKQYDEFLEKGIDKEKSIEYAANIFNARLGDGKPFVFNGNVLNHGSIPNLPYDACVEVPVVADFMGFKTTIAGNLPEHLAILVNTTARIENLVVEAAMKKSKEMVYEAVYMDPLSSAVLSLDEIRNMCDEIFEKNVDYLGDYK
ncbi:family 4 glycosyl hydrolase [Qingrenia yutianensis]|uniref:Alpha-glucosidase/alpha-galactosidase n=1 Tax=Qingrenia yutianensis TaxID=2763676 RepID=A0A926IU52_9FIRM|nr:alpha-glucosidase/alpha-galactosidase [Qingrenia yutianensis]MBC8596413.1 alpha-glucosidase/alpha-galactosidase [Qingrenia yutianensis]